MEKQKFRDMLKALHHELEDAKSLDEKGRDLLRVLMKDIQRVLDQSSEEESAPQHSLIEQLGKTIKYFEESHPGLALTMKKVIDTLSNMGI